MTTRIRGHVFNVVYVCLTVAFFVQLDKFSLRTLDYSLRLPFSDTPSENSLHRLRCLPDFFLPPAHAIATPSPFLSTCCLVVQCGQVKYFGLLASKMTFSHSFFSLSLSSFLPLHYHLASHSQFLLSYSQRPGLKAIRVGHTYRTVFV